MRCRSRTLGFAAAAAAAVLVLGVVSTVALAGHPQARQYAMTPWGMGDPGSFFGPMGHSMGGFGVDDEFDYLTHMVAHHREAVDAARHLERSGRAEMRALGASIVTTQSAEIAVMDTWLTQWYPGSPGAVGYRPMMHDLSGLTGDDLDEAFLRDMIPHHMAAVMMSQRLLIEGLAEHREVGDLARTVRDGQHAEIFQMQRFLADWFGGLGLWPSGAGVAGVRGPCMADQPAG